MLEYRASDFLETNDFSFIERGFVSPFRGYACGGSVCIWSCVYNGKPFVKETLFSFWVRGSVYYYYISNDVKPLHTHQQSIMILYTVLGQPGGGGCRFPATTCFIAYRMQRKRGSWLAYFKNCFSIDIPYIYIYTCWLVISRKGFSPSDHISKSTHPKLQTSLATEYLRYSRASGAVHFTGIFPPWDT